MLRFGATDTEVLACSTSGLKLAVFDLVHSKAVEISNPKFYQSPAASKGISIHPRTRHLAVLTRSGGKDMLSIHDPLTRQVTASWNADTVDAQGILWTNDGRWLLIWESPAQGHKLLIHSPDGQHFRSITAENLSRNEDLTLAPGIRICQASPHSSLCAIADHSNEVVILCANTWKRTITLSHPAAIEPRDTLQVSKIASKPLYFQALTTSVQKIWQEQLGNSIDGQQTCTFLRAAHGISPPTTADIDSKNPSSDQLKTGCSSIAFDASSTLLATKLDNTPCTLWIWDISAGELRAVLIFHSPVSFSWHPTSRELLLISCQDETRLGIFYTWDPLSEGPCPISADDYLIKKSSMVPMRSQASWINLAGEAPLLFLSNAKNGRLISFMDEDQETNLWKSGHDTEDTYLEVSTLQGDDGRTMVDNTFLFKDA